MLELQNYLNKLWTCVIEDHDIDLFNQFIFFNLKAVCRGEITYHSLKFKNVKSFYYLNGQDLYEPETDDYLELTSVSYLDEKVGVIANYGLEADLYRHTKANFMIEIWNREIFIESSLVEVDGISFEIKS
ncbi:MULTISPECIES: YxiG family protein [Paenibacillus]|uniref:YxiG family protein n=1 Tax=Paenibacillus TaxID=44249 RepID=UPI00073F1032|nr:MULTISPECIES: hypothetical protein [Paenibacillus]MDU4698582.1 hypothetical protein [Paenibacillus sp.]